MLKRIVDYKRHEVEILKKSGLFEDNLHIKSETNPCKALRRADGRVAIIAELKKASPVKGVLRPGFDLLKLAEQFSLGGADALSVVSDAEFFMGNKDKLREVRAQSRLPLLRKDFIIDEIQIRESYCLGADMLLLMASILSYEELLRFCETCKKLEIEVLLEIHDREELQCVRDLPVNIVGINNRNLKDFSVDIRNSLELAGYLPSSVLRISESGIHSPGDMNLLEEYGFQAALIGEALVSSPDPGRKLAELLAYREGEDN